ncbi:hypothetical protein XAP7430_830002 [Xanthomonas phaseoli pv. phaseoli]|uniref:Uncharacterized protein n=1 Tax=Xanthomonas campestris pv. phaseoli TaxID=317013 RepID=A0AB38E7F9_XANCH|nr:hypothetical protein XAP6984_860002 [Xanthomonas phaseoli pv. phaseoli]SON92681.1 hypothetical protein XAP7430_830002 [Xanthomonas phaseoli pv. phaseoli]
MIVGNDGAAVVANHVTSIGEKRYFSHCRSADNAPK